MITDNYIKMCEVAPRELWDKQSKNSRIGTLMAWRSFRGIVVPCEKRGKPKGLVSFIPETLVVRTWLKNDEDITILETYQDYPGLDGDRGTPLYTQEQLQEMLKDRSFHIWGNFNSLFMTVNTGNRDTHRVCWGEAKSMNELWLAFVMKEKYNKTWTGEKWAKETK